MFLYVLLRTLFSALSRFARLQEFVQHYTSRTCDHGRTTNSTGGFLGSCKSSFLLAWPRGRTQWPVRNSLMALLVKDRMGRLLALSSLLFFCPSQIAVAGSFADRSSQLGKPLLEVRAMFDVIYHVDFVVGLSCTCNCVVSPLAHVLFSWQSSEKKKGPHRYLFICKFPACCSALWQVCITAQWFLIFQRVLLLKWDSPWHINCKRNFIMFMHLHEPR